MKLSFSTLGCPDWNFEDIYSTASDLGFNGIEIRGIEDEIYAPKIKAFLPENIAKSAKKLNSIGLELPIITSGAHLSDESAIFDNEFEVKDYIMLASLLKAKYVRVMGEKTPEPVFGVDFDFVLEHYKGLCDFALKFGVDLLIETNGFLADSSVMKKFMEKTDRPNAGVIWDFHHTVRFFGEKPEYTVSNIGKYIKHTHVKDSVKGRNGKITYMLSGYGDIPIEEAVKSLNDTGYDGFYSYEWVKRWSRELAEAGVAFYQYLNYMKGLN